METALASLSPDRFITARSSAESDAERPRVSILIPTFNYARYLPEALDSVLAQDFSSFEVIVADDGSQDNSAGILQDYARLDPRIRIHCHPRNLGMVANWNWCLQQARGDYVKFLFGDDCFATPAALGHLVGLLDAAPGAVLAASARVVLDERSRPCEIWNEWRHPGRHRGTAVIARCLKEDRNLIGEPSAVLFRRTGRRCDFDSRLRQIVDEEMWFQLLLHGDFVYTPEPLCAFRVHDSQQTAVNRRAHIGPQESLVVLARYLDAIAHEPEGGPIVRRQMLFQRLYYFRKHGPRTPDFLAIVGTLRARLGPGWYAALWSWHRLTKPFRNLSRFMRRWIRGTPPASVSRMPSVTRMTAAH